jgi:hypothetical protein
MMDHPVRAVIIFFEELESGDGSIEKGLSLLDIRT